MARKADPVHVIERAHVRIRDPEVTVECFTQAWSDRYGLGGAGYYALEQTENHASLRVINRKPFPTREAADRWAQPLRLPKPNPKTSRKS